jgi:hypothetical protein
MSSNAGKHGQNKPISLSDGVIDSLALLGIDNLTLLGAEKIFEIRRRDLIHSFNQKGDQILKERQGVSVKEVAAMVKRKLEESPCNTPDDLLQAIERIINSCVVNSDLIKLIQIHDFLFEKDVEIISINNRLIESFE